MKSIIKRIIVGVAIGMILFFLKGYIVHASTITSIVPGSSTHTVDSGNHQVVLGLNAFTGLGKGKVIFNFIFNRLGYVDAIIYDIQAQVSNGGGINSCDFDFYDIQDLDTASTTNNRVYNVSCEVNLQSGQSLSNIFLRSNVYGQASNRWYVNLGYSITFISDDANNDEIIKAIQQQTSSILTHFNIIERNQSSTYQRIATDLGLIYTQLVSSNSTQQQQLQQQQQLNEKQQEQNDFLMDTSTPNTSDMDFSSNNASNGVISDLITMPIRLVQAFLNGFNSSCRPFVLGNLYGTNLTLPCIDLSQSLGAVWTMIDVIISGLFIYTFGKSCVKKFNDITNMKENQIDEVFD